MINSVLLVLAIAALAIGARAQTYYGSVRGLVVDKQGAAISQAAIVLTDDATKAKRTAVTNGSGEYVFTALEPASYTLTVQASGFKGYTQSNLIVATQQTVTADLTLTVGGSNETVEVTAASPQIDSSSASNGQVIDAQKLQNLPNAGRNPFLFAKLDTSVVPVGDPRFVRFQDQSGSSNISIAGGPLATNNYLIDGVPVTDSQNRAVIIPSLEAVDEVKVQSNTYDAEMGRTGGGVFNTTLRSGSNTLHGVLQGETRQTNWTANPFFNNRTPFFNGTTTLPTTPRGAAEFYSYVGAIGGPIPLPKLLGGKDKTFFWISEEGYRQRSPLGNSAYVPTALERVGDFSQSNIKIYDPTTPVVNGARTQFSVANGNVGLHNGAPADNVIPTSRLNAVGAAIAAVYPLPNQTPTSTAFGSNNFFGQDTLGDRADEASFKVDHQFFSRWSASASYLHYGSKEPGGNILGVFPGTFNQSINQGSYLLYRKVDATAVNSTFTVNPTTVVTAGFGFNRFPNNTLDLSSGYDQTKLGLPSSYTSALQKPAFPYINGTSQNLVQLGTANSGPAVFYSRSFVTGVSKSLGKHTLKAGYAFRSISVSVKNISGGNGAFNFDSSYTSVDGSKASTSGADTASLVLGFPSSGSAAITSQLNGYVHYNALYLQDDYRLSSKLTINLGFRYENEPGLAERNNHTAVGFDRLATNTVTGASGSSTLTGGVEFAGQNGYPTTCCQVGSKYAPRGGIAYELRPGTVVRGGFGIFNAPFVYTSGNLGTQSPGFTQTSTFAAPSSLSAYTGSTAPLTNPYPSGLAAPTGNTLGLSTGLGSSVSVIDQHRRAPIVQQYSFDLQQDLPQGFALKVGYVGAHSRNLTNSMNINQLPDSYLATAAAQKAAGQTVTLTSQVPNPYYQKGGTGVLAKATVPQSQLLLPFPQFTSVTESVSNGYSNYNALNVKLQKRFSHGYTILLGYTWASNWDNLWGASSSLNGGNNGPQTIYNLKSEYARAIDDIPNRLTIAGTYDLPFGRGKALLSNANRWLDYAIGGWSLNDVTVIQNGAPLAVTQGNLNAVSGTFGIGGSSQRPNVNGVSACKSGAPESRLSSYISGKGVAFTDAPAFTYGNSSRTTNCYGPGYANSDVSVNKTFKVTERVNVQFRGEALNAFNTPQFSSLTSTSIDSANFGKISGQLGFSRLIQLGGRLSF
jgi:hypothetical protein